VWVWDGGSGAARVVGRRHRVAAHIRSRLAAVRRGDRAGDDSPSKNGRTGDGWGRGAARTTPTAIVAGSPAERRADRAGAGVRAGAGSGARVGRGGPSSGGRAAAGRGGAGPGGPVRRSDRVASAACPVSANRARSRRSRSPVPNRA